MRVKRAIKQNITIASLLLHCLLLYPLSSLQTNGDGQSVSRQIKNEKRISWQQHSLAQLFGVGLSSMLQSAGVDRNKINIKRERERGEKKASRWIMNYWHRLYFMWLLNRSANVASRMTTWLQYALWPPQKDWSVFLNVQNSIRSRSSSLSLKNNIHAQCF